VYVLVAAGFVTSERGAPEILDEHG